MLAPARHQRRSRACGALILLVALLTLSACGDDDATTPTTAEIPSWAKVAPEQIAEAKKHGVPVAIENDLGMRFVLIPAGTFLMGCSASERARFLEEDEISEWRIDVERPQHEVRIGRAFYIQTTESTNAQFRAWQPDHHSGSRHGRSLNAEEQPVVQVSYQEVMGDKGDGKGECYVAWLSNRTWTHGPRGAVYRLPTEAEWEYACRAGTETPYFWGEENADAYRYANANDRKTKEELEFDWPAFPRDDGHRVAAAVASYRPNGWGLHDMLGNVFEWCSDWYGAYEASAATDPRGPSAGDERVQRGGCSESHPAYTRSAFRAWEGRGWGHSDATGFRLVVALP